MSKWLLIALLTASRAHAVGGPTVQVLVGPASPASMTAAAGTMVPFLQFTVSNTSTEAVFLDGVGLGASGSAADQFTNVSLYEDANSDGIPDFFLGGQPFGSDDGGLFFNFSSSYFLVPGDSKTFFLQGSSGSTLGTLIRSVTLVSGTGQTSGLPVGSASLPVSGNTVTVQPPHLQVLAGPFNPAPVTRSAGQMTEFLQFTVSNTGGETVNLNGFTFQASGSAQDQFTDLQIFNDFGADGVLDTFLNAQPFSADDGTLSLSFSTLILGPGDSRTFIVQGNSGSTLGTLLRSVQVANGYGQFSGLPITSPDLPLNSNTMTVLPPRLQVLAGPFNPAPVTRSAGQMTEFLQFTVSNTGGETVNLNGFTFQASGSAQDQFTDLQIFNDFGADGVPDTFLNAQPFSADDGTLSLSFSTLILGPGDSRTFIVQGNSGSTLGTLLRSVQVANGYGQFSGLPITSPDLPLNSNTMTVLPPRLQVLAGPFNPSAVTRSAGQMTEFLQFTVSNTGGETVNLNGFTFQASGSAQDQFTDLQIFNDFGADGVPDTFLNAQPFSADDGTLSLSFSTLILGPGDSRTFIVQGNSGSTLGTLLRSVQVANGYGQFSGLPITSPDLPLNSNTMTVLPPGLQVLAGPFNPAPVTRSAGQMTEFLQFTVSNTGGETVNLNGFTFQASGSAQDQFTDLQIFNDFGADGVPDTFLNAQPFSADDGTLSLSFSTLILGPGDSRTFIVQGNSGSTLGTLLRSVQIANGYGQFSGLPITSPNLPLNSSPVTVQPPQLQVLAGPFNPSAVTRSAGQMTEFLQFTVSNTGGETVNLNGFVMQATGTAQDQFTDLQLYDDLGADGVPDSFLTAQPFSGDNGTLALSFSTLFLGPGDSHTFILQGNSGSTVGTLIRSLQVANGYGQFSGLPITSPNLPLNSATMTVPPTAVQILAGPANPAAASVNEGALSVPVLQWHLDNSSGEPITLNGFKIQGNGTANEASLSAYRVVQDNNGNGLEDAGDVSLGSSNFAVNDGLSSIFIGLLHVPAGGQQDFLLVYDTGTAAGTHLPSLGDLIGSGDVSGAPLVMAGSAQANTLTVLNVTPTFTATATRTITPVITSTSTQTPSSTVTPIITPTFTPTSTSTITPAITATFTATPTSSVTPQITSTFTGTPTRTMTPLITPTFTATATDTPVITSTFTATPTMSVTPLITPTFTRTPSATFTQTPLGTSTPTFTYTISDTPQPSATAIVPAVLDQNVFRPGSGRPLKIALRPPEDGHVTVRVFNVAGERIVTPFEADLQAGLWFQAAWDGKNDAGEAVGSGVYIISVRGAGIRTLRKVVVLK